MSLSPFGRSLKINRASRPRPNEATLEDFSGGLDLSDNDLRLTTNFSKVLDNCHRDTDGTQSVRWGTAFKWDVSSEVSGNIIEVVYFREKLVVFTDEGEVCTILPETDTITAIWNGTIANGLAGSPSGWSSGLTTIDTTEFRNELVVQNGTDKPILISKTHTVTYLQDIPTGSNVFTPIGKFVTTVGNFCVVAGIASAPDEIYISSAGTSGTWPGDGAPNDATSINIASYSAETGSEIRGLTSFRNMLVVQFATASVVLVLGEYNESGTHVPRVLDTLAKHGVISHRTTIVLESEVFFADERDVHKAKRNVFGSAMESEKTSLRIQAQYPSKIPHTAINRASSFAIFNGLENRIMIFLKQEEGYWIYTVSFEEGVKKRAWSTFSGWDWTCGCSTVLGRVYFCKDTKVYQYGNGVFENEDYTADYVNDYDSEWLTATAYVAGDRVLEDGTVYVCVTDHTSDVFADDLEANLWEEYEGEAIDFDWELPWTDTNSRMSKKRLSYIGIDTVGTAAFTLEAYIDNFRYDEDGLDDPALSKEFVAGSSLGYGGGTQPYGGGRRAADERLWGFPCEFKILKLRFKGSIKKRLKFSAISLLYARGTYKR